MIIDGSSWWKNISGNKQKWPRKETQLSRGLHNGEPSSISKALALVCFFCGAFSVYKWGICYHCATGQKCPSHHGWTWTRRVTHSRAFQQSSSSFENSSSHHTSLTWSPLYGHSPCGTPICWVHSHLQIEKGAALPVVHLTLIMARGPVPTPKKSIWEWSQLHMGWQ